MHAFEAGVLESETRIILVLHLSFLPLDYLLFFTVCLNMRSANLCPAILRFLVELVDKCNTITLN